MNQHDVLTHLNIPSEYHDRIVEWANPKHGSICVEPPAALDLLGEGCDTAWTCDGCGRDWITEITGERRMVGLDDYEALRNPSCAVRAAAARLLHVQRLRDGLDPDGELGEVIGSVATALSRSARGVRSQLRIAPGGDHGSAAA